MWNDLWNRHRGACLGAGVGFLLGIVYLIAGFWDMLIFAFIVYLGYLAGSRLDRGEPLMGLDEMRRWLTERWRMFR